MKKDLAMPLQVDIIMITPFLSQRTRPFIRVIVHCREKNIQIIWGKWNTVDELTLIPANSNHPPLLESGCAEAKWKMKSWSRFISQWN